VWKQSALVTRAGSRRAADWIGIKHTVFPLASVKCTGSAHFEAVEASLDRRKASPAFRLVLGMSDVRAKDCARARSDKDDHAASTACLPSNFSTRDLAMLFWQAD